MIDLGEFPAPETKGEVRALNRALRAVGLNWCRDCRTVQPVDRFGTRKNNEGRAYPFPYCRPCGNNRSSGFRSRNPEYASNYYAENADHLAAQRAEYRAANAVKNVNRVQDPDETKRCRTCREDLPETRFSVHRRNADGLQDDCRDCANGTYRKACRRTHGNPESNVCHLCGQGGMTDATAHADHLVPRSKGGSDEGYNLRWAHDTCNVSRQASGITLGQLRRIAPQLFDGKWTPCPCS